MTLPPKEVECDCGNLVTMEKETDWCPKCAKKVFYEKKNKIKHQLFTWGILGAFFLIIFYITYIYLKLMPQG